MDQINELLKSGVHDGIFPGACYAVWKDDRLLTGETGNYTYDPDSPKVGKDTIWDLASLSKVIGTTSAVMLLVQRGLLDINKPVASVIPEFGTHNKDKITFRNLLVHNSGLIAFRPYHLQFSTSHEVMDAIYNEQLTYETGTKSVYSDLSMILIAEAIYRISGKNLDEFLISEVFHPLGMNHTGYFRLDKPSFVSKVERASCSPTEKTEEWRKKLRALRYGHRGSANLFGNNPEFIQGEVHDPTATILDGVAGHAGLFSTIGDLSLFLSNFVSPKPKLFVPSIRDEFVKKEGELSTRALGWDTKSSEGSSAGRLFGPKSYGHTGYTGTSVWCDPEAGLFAVLLTNRVHPTSENTKIMKFRPMFHELAKKIENEFLPQTP